MEAIARHLNAPSKSSQEVTLFLQKDRPTDMQLSSISETKFTLNGECPHCQKHAAFPTVTTVFEDRSRDPLLREVAVARCIACNQEILAQIRLEHYPHGDTKWIYEIHYPLGKPNDSVAIEIPDHIKDDFREALRCFGSMPITQPLKCADAPWKLAASI
jgi:hypothetical protein